MRKIEIEHNALNSANLTVNGQPIDSIKDGSTIRWTLPDDKLSGEIKIEFSPWKIDPLLRIDDCLINKWIGNVLVMDHALCFSLTEDYFATYRKKDIQGRLDSLGPTPTDITIDRVVGRNLHLALVNQIKQKLDEKRCTS